MYERERTRERQRERQRDMAERERTREGERERANECGFVDVRINVCAHAVLALMIAYICARVCMSA